MRTLFARLAPLALLALPLSLAASCKKPEYPQCKKDKHCKVDLGEQCVDGQCQNCATDDDCAGKGPGGSNWVCHELRCTDPAAIPARNVARMRAMGADALRALVAACLHDSAPPPRRS